VLVFISWKKLVKVEVSYALWCEFFILSLTVAYGI